MTDARVACCVTIAVLAAPPFFLSAHFPGEERADGKGKESR